MACVAGPTDSSTAQRPLPRSAARRGSLTAAGILPRAAAATAIARGRRPQLTDPRGSLRRGPPGEPLGIGERSGVGKSFGSYVDFATPSSPIGLGLYKRRALAKVAGVPAEGTGSHRVQLNADAGSFTDPEGFAWGPAAE